MKSFYDFTVNKIDGKQMKLDAYKGQVVLVVNVASKCGLTPQYEGLEALYEKYKDKGVTVLGFPANEFLAQEPGSNSEIQEFCRTNFGVKFPMFEKIVVKGEGQHPLYQFLIEEKPQATLKSGGNFLEKLKSKGLLTGKENDIKWNFEKFLISKQGKIVARFAPDFDPQDSQIIETIEAEIKK